MVPSLQNLVQVAREEPRLESELAVVDLGERGFPVGEFRQDRDRAERFIAIGLAPAVDIFEQVRLNHPTLPSSAAAHVRPTRARLRDPPAPPPPPPFRNK